MEQKWPLTKWKKITQKPAENATNDNVKNVPSAQ
jgi:hypothetical protein